MKRRAGSASSSRARKKRDQGETADPLLLAFREIAATVTVTSKQRDIAFRLSCPVCHGCRVNSKDNPNCFCCLAPLPGNFRKRGLWRNISNLSRDTDDLSAELRESTSSPVGLTNLGATCYINSILQCLYRIPGFLRGFFATDDVTLRQHPVLLELARIFVNLTVGCRSVVNPSKLTDVLQLDSDVQQDGQEFMKLFLSLLESLLSSSSLSSSSPLSSSSNASSILVPSANGPANPVLPGGFLAHLFRGTYSYVTTPVSVICIRTHPSLPSAPPHTLLAPPFHLLSFHHIIPHRILPHRTPPYHNATRCCECGQPSASSSRLVPFYELELPLHSSAQEAAHAHVPPQTKGPLKRKAKGGAAAAAAGEKGGKGKGGTVATGEKGGKGKGGTVATGEKASGVSVQECLERYTAEERLDGGNQMCCEQCGRKTDATRRVCIRSVPPVLNLHLMRFVFDAKVG
ncbi:unnamed protein product [Closterium sp. NIES-53]